MLRRNPFGEVPFFELIKNKYFLLSNIISQNYLWLSLTDSVIETNFSSSLQNITEAFAFERFLSKLCIPKVKNISIIITTWRWINCFNTYCFYLIVAKRITKKKPLVEFLSIAPSSPRPPKPDTNCQKKETLYKIKLITSLLLTYSAPKFESNCSRNNIWKLLFNIDNRENKNVSINETENSTNWCT